MPPRPSLHRERAAWAVEALLVGVDEAGRGPLAGPVVAAAVVFPAECRAVRGLRDSKILPARVRRPPLAQRPYRILIDGLPLPEVGFPHDALVDGDARCQSIAAAAIIAKTVRDRLMGRLAARHPGYGWETNMGYGTEEHHVGLKAHGPSCHHRLTFSPLAQFSLF